MRSALAQLAVRAADVRAARGLAPSGELDAEALDAALAVLAADHPLDAAVDPLDADASGDSEQRLDQLRRVFGLTALDVDLLVAAAAPDLDATVSRVYALLQGDPRQLRPSVGLALELAGAGSLDPAARERLAPTAPLRRYDLLQVDGDAPFLARALRVPDRVVAHLAGEGWSDLAVEGMLAATLPRISDATSELTDALAAGMPLVWVQERPGASGGSLAHSAFDALDAACLVVDLARRPPSLGLDAVLRRLVREAGLRRAGLVLLGADGLVTTGDPTAAPTLLGLLAAAPVPVVAVARHPWHATWLPELPYVVEADVVPPSGRPPLWHDRLSAVQGGSVAEGLGDGTELAPELLRLRLRPEEVAASVQHAARVAAAAGEPLGVPHLRSSVRLLSSGGLSGATRLRPVTTFDDLVLPPSVLSSVRDIVSWASHRDEVLAQGAVAGKGDKGAGITALFAGSPGTGKTLAAQVIAGALGLDIYAINLSTIVDKYIGETEKNLERVFAEAENLDVVLLFDEADALFGSRSEVRDARDRYANQEVAYLLQRMERFNGLALLATNLRGNLDPAFSRRLHFVVHFPDPDEATRRRLWEAHLAPVARLDAGDPVDVAHLAATVEVAGGDIRNIVLAAAYAAAGEGAGLGMRHVVDAVTREYRKLGRRVPVPGLDRS
ncbi:MAG: ATP-binding protein [Motilibacteraceae bacterium]